MKHTSLFIAAALSLLCAAPLQATVTLDIKRGCQDTTYNSKHYVLGVTESGNTVTINAQQYKVYKTGAFGAELKLTEGDNPIEVTVTSPSGEKQQKSFTVFYNPVKPKAPQKKVSLEEAAMILEMDRYRELDEYGVSMPGAFIQWGDGSDRLGGSKAGYIDEGIVFHITGEQRGLCKVQLSANRFAFIPREYLAPTPRKSRTINTGSWSITNDGRRDRIHINLGTRLPYIAWTEIDPMTISVDIYGAMNNSNWITQRSETSMIDFVDWRQVDSDIFRVIIRLKYKHFWGFSCGYEGNNLIITVKHRPELTLKGMKIGLDAGHGGKSSLGAVSFTGINEKDVNLDIVYRLKALLESKGATVVLSRPDDREVSMTERRMFFKKEDVDLMISVHNNAGGSPVSLMGTSTYYKHLANRELAKSILDRMLELDLKNCGLTGNFNFALGTPTDYPNCLVEGLFMSSLPEEEMIADPAFRQKMAAKICAGIEDYLNAVKKSEKK